MRVGGVEGRNVGSDDKKFCGPDRLPSQVTGQHTDGHLWQDGRLGPLMGYLAPSDQLKGDGSGGHERGVQQVERMMHSDSLTCPES